MELLDIAFALLALAFLLVAVRAHYDMERDDIAAHKTHFAAAAMLLGGMMMVLYLRMHGGLRVRIDRALDFSSVFRNMKLKNRRSKNRK